jgi:predicted HTH transcriptional regulator
VIFAVRGFELDGINTVVIEFFEHSGLVYRDNRWEYSLTAIREIVIDTIIHRDYSITGSDIKVVFC